MDHTYHGRPPTRRRPLVEASSRANENPQAQCRGNKHIAKHGASSSPSSLPHNESIVPNGTLAVNYEQPSSSPRNKRLSTLLATEPRVHNPKRDSDISNASTNASNTNRRRKTSIGPWQLGRTIGRGGCSRVRLVRHSGTGQYGAAKIISKATAEKVRALSLANLIQSAEQDVSLHAASKQIPFGLEREICIMKLLDHPHIVRLYDIWENRNELYLIMEFVEGGELFSYIHEQGGIIEIRVVHIFRQIIAALLYCHRLNIHHRDLKPENILLDRETMTVKLVDFGMAALQPPGKKLTTPCGSPHYAAPEVIKTISYDGAKADVWSCGVILYVLLTGKPPFNYSGEDRHLKDLFRDIQLAKYVLPDGLSPEANDLIQRILVADPKRRFGLDDIWHHPFMRKYQHELNFVGEAATLNRWIGPRPSIGEWIKLERATVDREILRYLRTLWHSEGEEVLIQKLTSKEQNFEKYFYSALNKYHTDQLENYQPDAHYAVTKSNSDHHHNTRHAPTSKDVEQMPSHKHKRSQSGYSILNDEHLYSKHSFFESPVSEDSYDPYRASRQPMIPDQVVHNQNVEVHRGHSNTSAARKPRPATVLAHHRTGSSLRVQALRNNSKRSSAMSQHSSNRSSPSHRSGSLKRRSISRSSLVSSHWPSSPPVIARSGGIGRRGVSFSHLRERRSSGATASSVDYSVLVHDSCEAMPDHRPHTSMGSYGSSDYGASHQSSPRPTSSVLRSKARVTSRVEAQHLKHRKPESPSKYIQSEARKVSTELGKEMEEAFNRSSVASSVRTSNVGVSHDMSQYDSPPTSLCNTRDSGGSLLVTPQRKDRTSHRPLPPVPVETPNSFLQRKLAETRAEFVQKLHESSNTPDHFNEVLEKLDRLMIPAANSKRTVSAPAKSPERPAALHVIPEEKHDGGEGPQVHRSVDNQHTIRLVDQSPTRIAPLNIRKRSSASSVFNDACNVTALPWSSSLSSEPECAYKEVQSGLLAAHPNQAAQLSEKDVTIKKKKSLWFRIPSEEKDNKQQGMGDEVHQKTSVALLQIPEIWQGLDDRINKQIPPAVITVSTHTMKPSASSNDSEFPMRNGKSIPAKGVGAPRKGFLGLFGKKSKEEKIERLLELSANHSSSTVHSGFDLGAEHGGDVANRAGPAEVQMNWFSRFLHIKPANKTLCFHIGRGKIRQDLVRLLRHWHRFGMRDVTFDRQTNIINARVDKYNHLKIKPVSFVIELFVVLEHGRRANLCLARFTQTRGAASSFRKVADIVEDVCRNRCMLVEDHEKRAAMMEVLS